MIEAFYSIDAETNLLGSVLLKPELLEEIEMSHTDFFDERHRYVVKALQALEKEKQAVDMVSLTTWLGEHKLIEKVGISYIAEIANSVPTAANYSFYLNIVKKYAIKRRNKVILERMLSKLTEADSEGDIEEVMSKGVKAIQNAETGKNGGFIHIRDVLTDVIDQAQEVREDITGIPTGFPDLDRMLGGFKGGELVIIGARPSMGKTAFVLNITNNAAKAGTLVAVYSLEMKNLSLGQRVISSEARVNSRKIKIGANSLNADEWGRMVMAFGEMSNTDILINDTSGITLSIIDKDLRKLRKDNPDREIMVCIDYLQLIQGDAKHRGNRTAEIGEISRTLKLLALELDISVVALSQLSRGVEQRQDKRPMMSDIRESGQIEQDADVIAFLYRDDYYNKDSEEHNIIECIIAKQREGEVGTVQLAFIKEYGRIVTLDRGVQ